jgi:hypothetical protein
LFFKAGRDYGIPIISNTALAPFSILLNAVGASWYGFSDLKIRQSHGSGLAHRQNPGMKSSPQTTL